MDKIKWLCLTLLAMSGTGCVGDINYDDIEPVCEGDDFDAPTRAQFCSGRLATEGLLSVPGRVVGADSRGGHTLIVATELPIDEVNGAATPLIAPGYNLYYANTQELLTGQIDALNPEEHPELVPEDEEAPLWAPSRVKLLNPEGTVGALLVNQFYGSLNTQQMVFQQLDVGPRQYTQFVPARASFIEGVQATDITAIHSGDQTLEAFVALGYLGLKHMRFTQAGGLWGEVIPPLAQDNDLLDAINGDLESYRHIANLCDDVQPPLRAECIAQCQEECAGVALRPRCVACRTAHHYIYGLETPQNGQDVPVTYGAWSLETDSQAQRILVGQFGQISVYPPEQLFAFTIDELNRTPTPLLELPLSMAQGVDIAEDYVVTQMQLTGDRLYMVAQHEDAIQYPIYAGPALESLPPSVLLHVPWGEGEPQDLESFRGLELPPAFNGTRRLELAVLDSGLVVVRGLEGDLITLGDNQGASVQLVRPQDPVVALYDTTSEGELEPLFEVAIDSEDESGLQGLVTLPESDHMLMAEPGGMSLYEVSLEGPRSQP